MLEFFEASLFTRQIAELLSDAAYSELQAVLVMDAGAGDLIPGTGGLRKIRWRDERRGKGKLGGIRAIYYWHDAADSIYMLAAYSKEQQDDLTAEQKRILKRLVREEFP